MIKLEKEKRVRQLFFICAGVSSTNDLHTVSIEAFSVEEAINKFNVEFGFKPKDVLGPFYQKRTKILANTIAVKMSPDWENAEYNGWNVRANILREPKNYAFLLFNNRKDGKNLQKPSGTIIVPIHDLRMLNAK